MTLPCVVDEPRMLHLQQSSASQPATIRSADSSFMDTAPSCGSMITGIVDGALSPPPPPVGLLLLPPQILRNGSGHAEAHPRAGRLPTSMCRSAIYSQCHSNSSMCHSSTESSDDYLMHEGMRRSDLFGFSVEGELFHSNYVVENKIGEGGFGKVYLARHKSLGIARAVKRLKKEQATREMRRNELEALRALEHPHIVRLVEYYDEEAFLYLVFELCEGPDLYDFIMQRAMGRLDEYEAAVALRHMLKALQCCHAQHRGHYDIKPENFMYDKQDCLNLKMIDLGLSSGFDRNRRNKIAGTGEYMAPEFWSGIYGPEGDVWSCGIVLFVMLTGVPFFDGNILTTETYRNEIRTRHVIKGRIHELGARFKLSNTAIELLEWMLQHDRHARPTVRECLKHAMVQHAYRMEKDQPSICERPDVIKAIAIRRRLPEICRAVGREPMLKRVARLAFAHAGQSCQVERLAYQMLDVHGYGEISIGALEKDFKERGAEIPGDIDQIFEAVDLNRDGYIGPLAFLSVTLPTSVCNDVSLCGVVFGMFDQGRDGVIDATDLEKAFGHPAGSAACKGAIAEVSADGRVTFEMFVQLMHSDEMQW